MTVTACVAVDSDFDVAVGVDTAAVETAGGGAGAGADVEDCGEIANTDDVPDSGVAAAVAVAAVVVGGVPQSHSHT